MTTLRKSLMVLICISMVLCSVATITLAPDQSAQAKSDQPQPVISFEPSLVPLQLTALALTAFPDAIKTPIQLLAPLMAEVDNKQYAVSGEVLIGGQAYPVGDVLTNADGISRGATEQAPLGAYGYAVIKDDPAYRLVWATSESGEKQYVIVHENDPLFAGDDGLRNHLDDLKTGIRDLATVTAPAVTAATTMIAIGLGACIPTAGTSCALAAVGATIAGVVGLGLHTYVNFAVVQPAIENVQADLQVIAANRGFLNDG